jgi:stress-induced morphogen
VSEVFIGKVWFVAHGADLQKLPARHRLVYDLLKEEMTPPHGSIHALQMILKTDEEVKAAIAKSSE